MADSKVEETTKASGVVVVGSKNPVKVRACVEAFGESFDEVYDFHGLSVPSGVSDQPMTDEETQTGAVNRARAAAEAWKEAHGAYPVYAVGLEGGVNIPKYSTGPDSQLEAMTCFAWMAVLRVADNKWGFGRTGSVMLPPEIMRLVQGGMELGHADDKVFARSNSKHHDGAVGILTKGIITRTSYYVHALTLALVVFRHGALFDDVTDAETEAVIDDTPAKE